MPGAMAEETGLNRSRSHGFRKADTRGATEKDMENDKAEFGPIGVGKIAGAPI